MSKSVEGNSNTAGIEELVEDCKIADVAQPESESASSKPDEKQLSVIPTQCFSMDELVKQGDEHDEVTKEIFDFHGSVSCPIAQCTLELDGCDLITHMLNDHKHIQKYTVVKSYMKIFVELKMFEVMQMEGTTCAAIILYVVERDGPHLNNLRINPNKYFIPYYGDENRLYLPIVLLMANSTLKCGDKVTCFSVATSHSMKNLMFEMGINNFEKTRNVSETVKLQSLRNLPDPLTLCATENECLYVEHDVMRYFYPKKDMASGKVLLSVQMKELKPSA